MHSHFLRYAVVDSLLCRHTLPKTNSICSAGLAVKQEQTPRSAPLTARGSPESSEYAVTSGTASHHVAAEIDSKASAGDGTELAATSVVAGKSSVNAAQSSMPMDGES